MVVGLVLSLSLALGGGDESHPESQCVWNQIEPASAAEDHRLRIVFIHTDGAVRLRVNDLLELDRTLQTPDESTGQSGELVCQTQGRTRLSFVAFGQQTDLAIDVGAPTIIYVQFVDGRADILVAEGDLPTID